MELGLRVAVVMEIGIDVTAGEVAAAVAAGTWVGIGCWSLGLVAP